MSQGGQFVGVCCHCKAEMWLPQALYEAARHSSKIIFHCAYGHQQIFSEAESEETKLRRERDRLKQDIAYWQDSFNEMKRAEKEAQKLAATRKGLLTKARKLAAAGVCPCCHRTVRQMALHMKSKHPDFKAEEVA